MSENGLSQSRHALESTRDTVEEKVVVILQIIKQPDADFEARR